MASLTRPSFPSSLQLKFHSRRSESPPVRIRFLCADRRLRLIGVAGAQASWNAASDPSSDSFAGWSGVGADGGGGEPHKNRFGGVLGAGLAGLFFVAGVTFASISLSSRTTSGVKLQMEPLTAEHEVALTSDDGNLKVDQDADTSSAVLPDKENNIDHDLGSETSVNKDPFLPTEINENDSEGGPGNIHYLGTSAVQNIEPTDNGVGANSTSVPFGSYDILLQSSAYETVEFSSDASSFKNSHNTLSSGTPDPVTGHDANLDTTNQDDISSTEHTTYNQEGNSSLEEKNNFNISENVFRTYGGPISSEATPPTLIVVESSDFVDSDIRTVVELATSISKEQVNEPGSMPLLPPEVSTSDPLVLDTKETFPSEIVASPDFDKNEGAPFIADSRSVLSEVNENVSDVSTQDLISRSLSFDSLPERTFSHAGIPAPSLVSATLRLPPGEVLVPAVVDQVQRQALSALQVLKVIEADVQPGDLCTRREYSRWLVAASSALSRNTISKVYPAMFIENVTELAFDDITPEDPDFSFIQGLAEAGIISSKLSRSNMDGSSSEQLETFLFSPESPLSRQDLVSWKMALEKRLLPEVNKNDLYRCSGYIDIDKIDPNAWPALLVDISAGEQSITSLAFGYTRLFQPNKPVTKAQAAIALATGEFNEVVGEELTRIEAESLAENAVNAHTALVAQVEKDLSVNFEEELAKEREKIDAVERLAEEARLELERLRAEREGENNTLLWGRAIVESEMEVLSRLRHELEEQLQELMTNKVEISFEKDRIDKLRKEAESENQAIVQLQYELEVERKALSLARSWAEEEAKKAREHARALEEARDRWERCGIKVVVDADLQEDASVGTTWLTAGEQKPVTETIDRAESLVDKLRAMSAEIKLKASNLIQKIIQKIVAFISAMKQWAMEHHSTINAKMASSVKVVREKASELSSNASRSVEGIRGDASEFSSSVKGKVRTVVEDCKGSVDKMTQKFRA